MMKYGSHSPIKFGKLLVNVLKATRRSKVREGYCIHTHYGGNNSLLVVGLFL